MQINTRSYMHVLYVSKLHIFLERGIWREIMTVKNKDTIKDHFIVIDEEPIWNDAVRKCEARMLSDPMLIIQPFEPVIWTRDNLQGSRERGLSPRCKMSWFQKPQQVRGSPWRPSLILKGFSIVKDNGWRAKHRWLESAIQIQSWYTHQAGSGLGCQLRSRLEEVHGSIDQIAPLVLILSSVTALRSIHGNDDFYLDEMWGIPCLKA